MSISIERQNEAAVKPLLHPVLNPFPIQLADRHTATTWLCCLLWWLLLPLAAQLLEEIPNLFLRHPCFSFFSRRCISFPCLLRQTMLQYFCFAVFGWNRWPHWAQSLGSYIFPQRDCLFFRFRSSARFCFSAISLTS